MYYSGVSTFETGQGTETSIKNEIDVFTYLLNATAPRAPSRF